MVRVGVYCIRLTDTHDHGQMIDSLDTFWGVCNTTLPIRDKYLINTYLLNLIPEKDWIVCVGAYWICPTNSHDHWQMIDPPDTCWGVCNTSLPVRTQKMILIYQMNPKPCTCRVACNTSLPMQDKFLINTDLLNPISGKDWMVHVGAYCIRLANTHNHGQMINPPDTCWGVCNTSLPIRNKYLVNTYLLNLIPDKDWMVRVGAFCIRQTNSHDYWQMIDPLDMC